MFSLRDNLICNFYNLFTVRLRFTVRLTFLGQHISNLESENGSIDTSISQSIDSSSLPIPDHAKVRKLNFWISGSPSVSILKSVSVSIQKFPSSLGFKIVCFLVSFFTEHDFGLNNDIEPFNSMIFRLHVPRPARGKGLCDIESKI